MKLLRYGDKGTEKPGLLDAAGTIRDLSGVIADFDAASLSPEGLDRLRALDTAALPAVTGTPRIGACLPRIGHFLAIGLNYADHAAESGMPVPAEPMVFTKAPSCLNGPYDDVVLPPGSTKGDWEVELAVVIGSRADNISDADAFDHIAGYCLCNDVSERAFQLEGTGQWLKGKSAPTFGPLGPWLVTRDEIPDPQNLAMFLDINGERMQTGSTKTMVFSVPTLVAYLSRFMVLEPGDVITTGTPPGVGMGRKPQRFLKAGDVMRLGVEGLGEQQARVTQAG